MFDSFNESSNKLYPAGVKNVQKDLYSKGNKAEPEMYLVRGYFISVRTGMVY